MEKFSQGHSHLFQTLCYSHGDRYATTSWLPSRLSYITLYVHGFTSKKVKPKSVDDLEIVKIAETRCREKGHYSELQALDLHAHSQVLKLLQFPQDLLLHFPQVVSEFKVVLAALGETQCKR